MENTIYIRTYEAPPIDRKQILRYAGVKEESAQTEEILNSCIKEAEGKAVYRVCYREFPVRAGEDYLDLDFLQTASVDLQRNLKGCRYIILFAATVGIGIDRLISKYSRISPVKALFFQAIGAERIESLCDTFNNEITDSVRRSGGFTKPRFSPGYGDLPIGIQKDIFRVLDCPRKIGLSLNESLLMSPSKSVTAIIGVGDSAAVEIGARE